MTLFSTFAQQYLAKQLGVSTEEAERLYAIVQRAFHINVTSNKYTEPEQPETFSAYLTYTEGSVTTNMILFKSENEQTKFTTPKEAFDVAIKQVNSIEFTGIRNFFLGEFPPNVLLLLDTQLEQARFEQTCEEYKNFIKTYGRSTHKVLM